MVGHRRKENPLAALVVGRRRRRRRRGDRRHRRCRSVGRRPPASRDERGEQQHGERAGQCQPIGAEPGAPPRHLLLGQLMPDALPDLEAVLVAAVRRFGRRHQFQCRHEIPVRRRALSAAVEMLLERQIIGI